jgi:hypothetical protein
LLQTRTLWLPGPQTEGEGAVDCAGGIGLPDDGLVCVPNVLVCASAAASGRLNKNRKASNPRLIIPHARSSSFALHVRPQRISHHADCAQKQHLKSTVSRQYGAP